MPIIEVGNAGARCPACERQSYERLLGKPDRFVCMFADCEQGTFTGGEA